MRRDLRAFDFSANVPWIRLVDGVIGAGMGGAGTGEDGLGFGLAIGLPNIFHMQDAQHDAFGIAQRNFAGAGRKLLGKFLGDIQGNGHRPKSATGQPHIMANAFIIGAGHKSPQRRETTRG